MSRTLSDRGFTIAIVQSRHASTRLPGKALADIHGHPLLWHVVRRAREAELVDAVVVATGVASSNDPIVDFCQQENLHWFRGSDEDVLSRYYECAVAWRADVICRVNGDTPLYCGDALDSVISFGRLHGLIYATNADPPMLPDGLDSEAFTFDVLAQMHHEAKLRTEREHVTPWLRNGHLERLTQWDGICYPTDYSDYRACVDLPEDLAAMRRIFEIGGDNVSWRQAVEMCGTDPALVAWHRGHLERDAAYKAQLAQEAAR